MCCGTENIRQRVDWSRERTVKAHECSGDDGTSGPIVPSGGRHCFLFSAQLMSKGAKKMELEQKGGGQRRTKMRSNRIQAIYSTGKPADVDVVHVPAEIDEPRPVGCWPSERLLGPRKSQQPRELYCTASLAPTCWIVREVPTAPAFAVVGVGRRSHEPRLPP